MIPFGRVLLSCASANVVRRSRPMKTTPSLMERNPSTDQQPITLPILFRPDRLCEGDLSLVNLGNSEFLDGKPSAISRQYFSRSNFVKWAESQLMSCWCR